MINESCIHHMLNEMSHKKKNHMKINELMSVKNNDKLLLIMS